MSKDKSPCYTYVRFRFWEGTNRKESLRVFIWINDENAGIHVGMHRFPKDFLVACRDSILDNDLGSQLMESLKDLDKAGKYEISEPHYKKVPRGYDRGHPRAALLRHNTLNASSPMIQKSILTKADLVEVYMDHVANMIPLHHWLLEISKRLKA